jgi:hypothetical protein
MNVFTVDYIILSLLFLVGKKMITSDFGGAARLKL